MAFLPTSYFCIKCKTIKPWYRFQYGVHDKQGEAVCFTCNKNGVRAETYLKKIRVENQIERLIRYAMKNKMIDLRNHLFETLEKVKDDEMKPDKAKAICEIAQIIINSAKVEIDYIRAIGGKTGSDFLRIENASNSDK